MPTTDPTYGWTLPVLADAPDGPSQMSALAAGIAATLQALPLVQSGVVTLSFSNSATGSLTITFPVPFASAPNVVASSDGSLNASYRGVNTDGISATGVQLFSRTHSDQAASGDIQVQWIAVGVRA
jgi:hypothetical protein